MQFANNGNMQVHVIGNLRVLQPLSLYVRHLKSTRSKTHKNQASCLVCLVVSRCLREQECV